jgi:ribosomal protein S18 acetylase RimI-like enzyme
MRATEKPTDLTYVTTKGIPAEKLIALYAATDYNARWTEGNVRAMLDHVHTIVTAWSGDQLIGTVGVVSDGVNYAEFDGLLVHPSCRNKGIGSELMRRALEVIEPLNLRWVQLRVRAEIS